MAIKRVNGETETNGDTIKNKSEALTEMSEEEISNHLALCLKLDAENKINTKNAFGLHLIDIMRHKIKHTVLDLQSASMSLQASSKIYGGRVDALYKDTFAFHNQLQTIVSNKKVVEDRDQGNDGNAGDDDDPKEKRKTIKAKQSYITSEDNVSFKSENTYRNTMHHANFIAIKSAFAASRTAPKLLERLPLQNDSSKIFCTTSLPCYNPVAAMTAVNFSYPAKRKNLIQKIQNISLNNAESSICSDVFLAPAPKSPVFEAPDFDVPSDDSFCLGTPPAPQQQDADVDDIINKFSVLDITADILVKDLSLAIVDANTVDRNRLPPNSALKRVLNTVEKSKQPKTPAKVQKEKLPREPFFDRQRVLDRSILKKGRKIELTDKDWTQWSWKDTTEKSNGTQLFSTLLADDIDKKMFKKMHKLMQENVPDGYFCKEIQLWNNYGKQRKPQLIRPSSFGICRSGNDSNAIASESPNLVVESFQNLSLQNSPARSDDYDDAAPIDVENMDDSFILEPAMLNRMSRSGDYEDDLKSFMVTPPEIAQPITMRFETKPITLSTEKVKNAIWNFVEQSDVVLLSNLHKGLQKVFEKEYLPLQYVFTTLLILANEKCLLLENISKNDINIMKDILE